MTTQNCDLNTKKEIYVIAFNQQGKTGSDHPKIHYCPEMLESLEDTEKLMIEMVRNACRVHGVAEALKAAGNLYVFSYSYGKQDDMHSVYWDYTWRDKYDPKFPKLCNLIDRLVEQPKPKKKKKKIKQLKGKFNSVEEGMRALLKEVNVDGTAKNVKEGTYMFNVQVN